MNDVFLSLNRYGVLKVPLSLWLIVLIQARHWVLFVLVIVSAPMSRDSVNLIGSDFSWAQLALEAPILLLVVAIVGRHPDAGNLSKALWRRGREIISCAVLVNALWVVWFLVMADFWRPWPERAMLTLGLIDLAVLIAVWKSEYYRQLFSEFPEADAG